MIKLRATECRGRLLETVEGEWLTNGHWMIRKHLCKVLKAAPDLSEHRPDYGAWRSSMPSLECYRRVQRMDATLNGHAALAVDDQIVAWADPEYLDLLAGLGGGIYVAGECEPIVFAIGCLKETSIVAWLMPVQQRVEKSSERAALIRYLERLKQ